MEKDKTLEQFTKGLPDFITKNAVTAISSGISGIITELFNVPINFLRNYNEGVILKGNLKRKYLEKAATLKTSDLEKNSDLIDRALNFHSLKLIDEQINREVIAADTLRILSNKPKELSAERAEEIDIDWLTQFWSVAQTKSKEDVQQIFAKILAEEIISPGQISLSTLQAIAYLDSNVGNAFQKLCNISICDGDLSFAIHPNIGGFMSRGNLDEFGISLKDQLNLNGANLINSIDVVQLRFSSKNVDFAGKESFFKSEDRSYNLLLFTPVGHELRQIIEKKPNMEYLKQVNGKYNCELLKIL